RQLVGLAAGVEKAEPPHALGLLPARRERPRCRRAADERDELAAPIKKTRSHGTIAKRVGLAKSPRSAKSLPFSSSRVGSHRAVRNSLDHLVGELLEVQGHVEPERLSGLEVDN